MKNHVSSFLLFAILLTSCGERHPVASENPVQENDSTEKYLTLVPIDSNAVMPQYQLNGFVFEMEGEWKVQQEQGVDFVVSSLLSPGSSRFFCYFGWYPDYPYPIDLHLKKQRYLIPDSIPAILEKRRYYQEKVECAFEDGMNADSTIKYRQDSMLFEVYRMNTKDVWIRRPLKNPGPIDIGVIFKADSVRTKLHLFGDVKNWNETLKLIRIAKSVEKRL